MKLYRRPLQNMLVVLALSYWRKNDLNLVKNDSKHGDIGDFQDRPGTRKKSITTTQKTTNLSYMKNVCKM